MVTKERKTGAGRVTGRVAAAQKVKRGQQRLRRATINEGTLTLTSAAAYLKRARQCVLYHVGQGNLVEVEPPCLGCKCRVVTLASAEALKGRLWAREEKIAEGRARRGEAGEEVAVEETDEAWYVESPVESVDSSVADVESTEGTADIAEGDDGEAQEEDPWASEDEGDEEPVEGADEVDGGDEDLTWEE